MRYVFFLFCSLLISQHAHAERILVLGDSLSAAYGLPTEQGWVSLLQQRLAPQGWQVINASISGETSSGGLSRLPPLLDQHRPTILIIGLGANDGLRGHPLATLRGNLGKIIDQATAQGATVLLLGMQIPPNYGPRYSEGFSQVYQDLGARPQVELVPFLLEKVALDHTLMLQDNLHPNAQGQPLLLDTLWPPLQVLLRQSDDVK